jgi:hypothetical protein
MPFGQSWQYYYNSDLIKKEINNKWKNIKNQL